jgi:hypothetical protein
VVLGETQSKALEWLTSGGSITEAGKFKGDGEIQRGGNSKGTGTFFFEL